ncbi:MAG: hypothetical protein NTV57_15285 [Cyanobacteria bacterium]|nr:hypothetical protein [Cyanobacteriota bacterium]
MVFLQTLSEGLLAIAEEIHNQPEAEAHSLSHWLTWLDEEGYDQPGIARALQQLCQQRLGAEAGQQLQAQAKARADDPQGVPSAIEHLSQNHPELLEELLAIEQTRQEELQRIHAMAGGLSKFTRNTLIAGAVGIAFGSVCMHFVNKKYAEKIARLQSDFNELQAIRQDPIQIQQEFSRKFMDELSLNPLDIHTSKTVRLFKPLTSMSDNEIDTIATCAYRGHFQAACITASDMHPEINARLMRIQLPDHYIQGLNKWASTEEGKAAKLLLSLQNDAEHTYKKIKDIDRDLLSKYESSEFVRTFMKTEIYFDNVARDAGIQAFAAPVKAYYTRQLKETRNLLQEKAANGAFTEEETFFDKHVIIDLSPDAVRDALNRDFETSYRYWLANPPHVLRKWEDMPAVWKSKSKVLEEADPKIKAYLDGLQPQIDSIWKDFREGVITEAERLEKLQTIKNDVYQDCNIDLQSMKGEFFAKVIKPSYFGDRDKIIADISQAEALNDNAKIAKLGKDLEDLEDFPSWLEGKADQLGSDFDHFVETETTRVAESLKRGLSKIRAETAQAARNEINKFDGAASDTIEEIKDVEKNVLEDMEDA